MDMSDDNDKIIRGVYYDQDSGLGLINDTYKQSHRILNTITLTDVKDLFKQTSQGKHKLIGASTVMWQKKHYKKFRSISPISHDLLK